MGRLKSSVSVDAEGPFAMPSTPWHFQHCTRANTSCPALTRSGSNFRFGGNLNRRPRLFFLEARREMLHPSHQIDALLLGERVPDAACWNDPSRGRSCRTSLGRSATFRSEWTGT